MYGMTLAPFRHRQDSAAGYGDQEGANGRWRTLREAVWAPVPWMLEAVIVLLLAVGDYPGMATVAVLLGFNVACGLFWDGCVRSPKNASHPDQAIW